MLTNHPTVLSLSRYEFADQFLRKHQLGHPQAHAYDVGAGDGRMKSVVEAAGLSWHGFDLLPRATDIEQWDLSNSLQFHADKATFVLMLDVLEHLPNPGLGLQHVAEVMIPGGGLVLTMPNPRWSRSRIHALITGYPACFTQNDLDGNGHVFTPWPHVVEKLLNDAGFKVREYLTLDGRTKWPKGPISVRYPLRIVHAGVNKIIERLDPTACGMSYAFVAELSN